MPERKLRLAINGRFTTRPITGVDRVAYAMTKALAQVCQELGDSGPSLTLQRPRRSTKDEAPVEGALPDGLPTSEGRLSGLLWEHLELPFADGDWTLNFCNTAPLVARARQATFIHDAQVYLTPSSYSLPFRTWYRFLLPRIARRADLLATVSEYSEDNLLTQGVVPRRRTPNPTAGDRDRSARYHVIHNGVDHLADINADASILPKHGLVPDQYCLAIASSAPHKNISCLIDAFSQVESPPGVLALVGTPDRIPPNHRQALQRDNIRCLGRCSDGELKALYAHANAFLFPSKTEGFGLPPLEAMRCGCPVIASNGGAIAEVCGSAPRYASPDDWREWRSAIIDLYEDSACRQEIAAAGRRRASGFTWRRAALNLLTALAKATPAPELLARLTNLERSKIEPSWHLH